MALPDWQTDDLADAWPSDSEGDSEGECSVSFTEALAGKILSSPESSDDSGPRVGTVVVKLDEPALASPAKRAFGGVKDFFSPSALERMFEPPPKPPPSRHPLAHTPNIRSGLAKEWVPEPDRQFTFAAPSTLAAPDSGPQAQSTPLLNSEMDGENQFSQLEPGKDGKTPLKLFQFQYDTYTRAHLSAVVDSLAISPQESEMGTKHIRSAKRVRLSPPTASSSPPSYQKDDQTSANRHISIGRPLKDPSEEAPKRDYVQASRNLMDQIKAHARASSRDYSTGSSAKTRPLSGTPLHNTTKTNIPAVPRVTAPTPASSHGRAPSNENFAPPAALHPPSPNPFLTPGAAAADMNRFVSGSSSSSTLHPQRFVSSSTATIGSDVKHAGTRQSQLHMIRPEDVQDVLGERVGGMRYDKTLLKWTRDGDDSADVFRGIQSLSIGGEQEERESEHPEGELTASLLDGLNVVPVMTGEVSRQTTDYETTDDDEEPDDQQGNPPTWHAHAPEFSSDEEDDPRLGRSPPHALPVRPLPSSAMPPRTALPASVSTPRAALPESASGSVIKSAIKATPKTRTHARSVSFSDGRKEGPIVILNDEKKEPEENGWALSGRSKRIAAMMEDLENDDEAEMEDSPSTRGRNRTFARSFSSRAPFAAPNGPNTPLPNTHANMTLLTECSFGVAHDALVTALTDAHPSEPYWSRLSSLAIRGRALESVARLKELAPSLEELELGENKLTWLSGIPPGVRRLSVTRNLLSSLTSFGHIPKLQILDIGHNEIDSLRQLSCLTRLRELRAEGNSIENIEGIQNMKELTHLGLRSNKISQLDLATCSWSNLETLDLSHNRVEHIKGVAKLSAIIHLNLDYNSLREFRPSGSIPTLRVLRLSHNRLHKFDADLYPALRTLWLDENDLHSISNARRLTKLENLSIREQRTNGNAAFDLDLRPIRDMRRLYLSGNALNSRFMREACYNLVYVELAGCRLRSLPLNLATLIPNARVVNLNYNFLEDLTPLKGLTRVKKLSVIGGRTERTKALLDVLKGLPDVEILDFRMNPCTLGWYLPLLVKDVQKNETDPDAHSRGPVDGWKAMDAKFRRDLPHEMYLGRLTYRGMAMRACHHLKLLDGVPVEEKERVKAENLLNKIQEKIQGKGS